MKPLDQCQLYTFIDTAYLHGRPAATVAKQLCEGGSDLIQLRAKDSTPEQIRQLAIEVLPILHAADVGLVINDHWDIACQVGADICHLGQEDFFGTDTTQISHPPHKSHPSYKSHSAAAPLLGLSTHAPDQATRALAANPAYIAIGPVYATGTKPSAQPVTLEYVRWAATNAKTPWFAIGGITLANLSDVLQAGASRICVVSAILNAPDIRQACHEFKTRLEQSQR